MKRILSVILACMICSSTFLMFVPVVRAESVDIYLYSRDLYNSNQDLGTIIFEPEPPPSPPIPNLPRMVTRETRPQRYQATFYPPSRHVIHHWEFSGGINVPDAGMPLPLIDVYVTGPSPAFLIAVYEEVPATIHLESKEIDDSTANLGTMDFDGAFSLGLPCNVQRVVSGSPYQATYYPPPQHEFDHWETTDGVSVPDPYIGPTTDVYVSYDGTLRAVYKDTPLPPYDVTIAAYCYAEGTDPGVLISPAGVYTPHTFTGLTGSNQFTVPNVDPSGHPFRQWNTGETSTTIIVVSEGTYTAYYEANQKPVAVLDVDPDPPVVNVGTDVWFYGTDSYDPDGDQVVAYLFDFGDGESSSWLDYPTVAATHSYSASSPEYWAKLKVKDDYGLESDWCDPIKITVLPIPGSPVAILEATPLVQEIGLPITFDASQSYDPDGEITEYYFDYGDDNGDWTTNAVVSYSYSEEGEYYPKVLVSDNSGLESWSESTRITIIRTPISITKILPASTPSLTATFYQNDLVMFLIEVSDQNDNPIVGCSVDGMLTPPSPLTPIQLVFEDGNDGTYTAFYQIPQGPDAVGDYSIIISASSPRTTTISTSDYFRVDGSKTSSEYLLGRVEEGKLTECYLYLRSPTTTDPRITTFYFSSQSDDILSCYLESPKGNIYSVTGDQNLQTVSVENPEPGNWKFVVYPQQTITQSSVFAVGYLDEYRETSLFSQNGVVQSLERSVLRFAISKLISTVLELTPLAGALLVSAPLNFLTQYVAGGYDSVTFASRTTDGKENVGGIVMDGKAYTFSSSQQIAESSIHHTIYATAIAPLGYTFSHWETNTPNEISFSDPDKPFTEIYPDSYGGSVVAVFEPTSSSLRASIASSIDILITAPDGLRIGYDPVIGSVINEIPGATYSGNGTEPQIVIIPSPMDGNYVIQTFGTGIGSYEITLESTDNGSVTDSETWEGTALPDQQYMQTINLDTNGELALVYDLWTGSFAGTHPIVDFATYNGTLYVASDNHLYVYNGDNWTIIQAPTYVLSLMSYEGKLCVGGEDGLYSFNGTDFTPVFNTSGYVKVLGIYNNTLYVGTVLDNSPILYYCNGSAENPDNWYIYTAFSTILNFSGPFGSIDSFAVFNNAIYVTSGGAVYSYNGTYWSIVATYVDVSAFLDMKVYNGKLYLATRDQAWRKPYYLGYSGFSGRVIEFDGSNWTTIFDHDYWIYSLETYDGKLYAGTANRIFTYNGTHWETSFHSEERAYYAISLIAYDGKLYAGMGNGYIFVDPSPEIMQSETVAVPEFSSFIFLSLFMLATLVVVLIKRRKRVP